MSSCCFTTIAMPTRPSDTWGGRSEWRRRRGADRLTRWLELEFLQLCGLPGQENIERRRWQRPAAKHQLGGETKAFKFDAFKWKSNLKWAGWAGRDSRTLSHYWIAARLWCFHEPFRSVSGEQPAYKTKWTHVNSERICAKVPEFFFSFFPFPIFHGNTDKQSVTHWNWKNATHSYCSSLPSRQSWICRQGETKLTKKRKYQMHTQKIQQCLFLKMRHMLL